ncbi:TIR domain-containing protein [Nocardia sp. NPDC052254]|uniref:nSTAND1 domain-containing NTPase n=1 Tax=Nocardia sp. NPDC052254 TaxID=3155681 RepID=UPI00342112E7
MTRVFISHSGRDNAWAVAVKQWLVEQQPDLAQEIFLDIDPRTGIHSGQRWKDALRAAKERCEAVVCLVSRNWLGSKECEAEYRAAEYFGKRIYCARIEPLDGLTDITREWQRCDLYGNGPYTEVRIDARPEPIALRTAGLQQLLTGLRSAGIGTDHFPWPPPDDPDRAPYRGWEPFEPVDAAVFFGRDGQVLRAMDTLRAMRTDGTRPLFVVVGASGTGKSSFLRAGLIPRLTRDDRHFAVLDILRPERHALTGVHGLAAVVYATRRRVGLPAPDLGDVKTALTEQDTAALRQWLIEIQQAARHRLGDPSIEAPTLVLPIDQAEELLSTDAGTEGTWMLDLLAGLLTAPVGERPSLIVAATIRTDRYERLQSTQQLADVATVVFDDLKPMPRNRFRDIITGPAGRSLRHLEVEPDLVDQLLADCGDGADALPLLSLTLATLHRDYGASGTLTRAQYTKRRGIGTVVATEMDAVLSHDPRVREHELALLRSAFIPLLATVASDNDQPLRRIARWRDLPAGARPLIDRFVDRRLLVKDHRSTGDDSGETVVEVALESLLRQWDDLAGWLREEAEDLRTADNLERSADDWHRNDRSAAWLLNGARLIAAENLADRPGYRERLATTRNYLAASREGEDARHADELRRARAHADSLRRRARILVALATVAILVAITAGVYYLRADTAEHRASDLADASIAARLARDAQQRLSSGRDQRRSILEILAAHALSSDNTATALLAAQLRTQNITKILNVRSTNFAGDAVSPDGRWIVTCDGAKAVWVWDTTSDTGPKILPDTGSASVDAVAVSPDGRWVATGDDTGAIRIWDTTTDNGPKLLPNTGSGPINVLAIRQDGRRIATGGIAGAVEMRDTTSDTGPKIQPDTGYRRISAMAVSPDGRWTVTGDDTGAIRVWDTTSDAGPKPLPGTGSTPVNVVAISPDGRRIVIGERPGTVRVWDTVSGGGPRTLPETDHRRIGALAVSPDARWLATGDDTGAVQIWDMASDAGPKPLPGTGSASADAVAVGPDGRWVAAGDETGAIRLWDTTSDTGPKLLPDMGSQSVGLVAVRADGRRVVTRDTAGVERVWDSTATVTEQNRFPSFRDNRLATAVTPDGRWTVTGDGAGTVEIWDTASGAGPRSLPAPGDKDIVTVAVTPDGRWVAAGDLSGGVRVWDTTSDTGPKLLLDTSSGPVALLAISLDGRRVVADDTAAMRVWDTTSDTGPKLLSDSGSELNNAVAVSPDGRWIATGDLAGAVRVWDTTSDTGPRALPDSGSEMINAVALSPDGRWIATGNLTGAVRVWSTGANQSGVALYEQTVNGLRDMAFDPGMRSIDVLTKDGGFAALPFPVLDPKQLCSKLTTTMSKAEWDEWVTPSRSPAQLCDGLNPPPSR